MARLTVRAYAAHRAKRGLPGKTHRAVQKALRDGRIAAGEDGLIDPDAADLSWEETTDPGQRRSTERTAGVVSLAEARTRLDLAKAELAEIDLAVRKGELLVAADVEARVAEVFAQCKTKLLGVSSRARQQDPALTVSQVSLFDGLIR